ncbi:hypothetical protein PVAND_001830 [Polypedilum vanderplanki]|uniref:Uncharacterized protein n=1 Tax=Polypedilum vanderplanki TaxID=319348 RepID=A0A9J6BPJ1_POLVA|nr:hypothetical protein PVAND_001830 [Polypedilum vanderplanki]
MNEKFSAKRFLNSIEIDNAIEIYDKLYNVINLINKNLTFVLITYFGYSLIEILFSTYCIVREHVQNTSGKYVYSFPSGMWVFGQMYLMIISITASTNASTIAKKTKTIT